MYHESPAIILIMKLLDYIQGKRRGKEANKLEREAMNDPFLQDAIDGFDAVPGDHASAIEELEALLQQKMNKPKPVIQRRFWTIGAAAALVLFLGIGSLLLFDTQRSPEMARKETKKILQPIIPAVVSESIPQPATKSIAQNIEKPVRKTVRKPEFKSLEIAADVMTADNLKVSDSITELKEIQVVSGQMANRATQTFSIGAIATDTNKYGYAGTSMGRVLDEAGRPITGATIRIAGTNLATVSDINGKFQLKAPEMVKSQFVATFIGYEKQEVPVSTDSTIIQLKPSNLALNEVAVVGYGAKKQIKLHDLNVNEQLQGRVAGVDVSRKQNARVYGEKEFENYFQQNRSDTICTGQDASIEVSFSIDNSGKPTDISYDKSTCEELKIELTRLLINSPKWTRTGRKVKMLIVVK